VRYRVSPAGVARRVLTPPSLAARDMPERRRERHLIQAGLQELRHRTSVLRHLGGLLKSRVVEPIHDARGIEPDL